MRYFITLDGKEHVVDVAELPGGALNVKVIDRDADGAETGSRTLSVDVLRKGPLGTVDVDARIFDLVMNGDLPKVEVFASGRRAPMSVETARMRATADARGGGAGASSGIVVSPMPGKVVKILVAEGATVSEGTPLIVVEAMKMENELVAESEGTILKVHVGMGDTVEGGAKLITIG
jgi:glutaconyl-CoA/methylmalonyl-CoA decarboxylase subunit gamma